MSQLDAVTSAAFAASVPAPAAGGGDEATRQLCAAAELDRGFAAKVVGALEGDPFRALAASPGVDLAPVVAHALAARRRWLVLDGVLAVLLAVAVGLAFANPYLLVPAFLAVWALGAAISWRMRESAAATLGRGRFDRAREAQRLPFGREEISALQYAQTGNVSVYSGFFPFVGSGRPAGGWSLAVGLETKEDDPETGRKAVADFSLAALYEAVERELCALADARIDVERRLFVDGRDIRRDVRFLSIPTQRPRVRVPDQLLDEIAERPERSVRHYTCLRIVDWEGELVLSIFLRFERLGRSLYAEADYVVLSPVQDSLRAADRLDREEGRLTDAVGAGLAIALRWPFTPLALFGAAQAWNERRTKRRTLERAVERDSSFDYGARPSIREEAAGSYRRYFQLLDKEMYVKVAERQLLDGIVAFLDAQGVDTSELRSRQETILNQGLIISGGDVKVENSSIGQRAQTRVQRVVGVGGA